MPYITPMRREFINTFTEPALEGAKLEFYRRIVAPYEELKIKENGEVY